jgi:kynurenine formamidase
MAAKIVDLSVPLESFPSEFHDSLITYWDHRDSARRLAREWGIDPAQLPRPYVAGAKEEVTALTHAGTHLDAPWHFGPLSEGKPAKTVDEMPLDWCFGDGIVLDFSSTKNDGDYIHVADVQSKLAEVGHVLKPGDIVLFNTGAGAHWGAPDYGARGSGLTDEVVFWFYRQGVRVQTTDAYTLDIPVPRMVEKMKAGDKAGYFPVHRAGRKVEYTHAEKVVNLESLPAHGFKVALFPVKVRRASGAWTRAVAIFDDELAGKPLRLVDLSAPLENFAADPEPANISYWDHYDFARRSGKGQGIDPKTFPEPYIAGAMDIVTASSQAGTHMLAPWYFCPGNGAKAMTIDQVPLDWCYGNAVVLDFSPPRPAGKISDADIRSALASVGHELRPGDIVMLRTGAGATWGQPAYLQSGAALSREGLRWLVERGVKIIGTDAATLDEPLAASIEKLRAGAGADAFELFEAGSGVEFACVPKVIDLQRLPATGAKIALFPVKLRKAGSAWCRAVGLVSN